MRPVVAIVGAPETRRVLVEVASGLHYPVEELEPGVVSSGLGGPAAPRPSGRGDESEGDRQGLKLDRAGVLVLCMRDLDAASALARVRRDRLGASLPVILFGTPAAGVVDLADLIDLGADHFMAEPLDRGEFERALLEFIGPPQSDSADGASTAFDPSSMARDGDGASADELDWANIPGAEGGAGGQQEDRDELQPHADRPGPEGEPATTGGRSSYPVGDAGTDPGIPAGPGESGAWPFDFGTSPGGEFEAAGGRDLRGRVLGNVHRTLEQVDASLGAESDPDDLELAAVDDRELAELGLDAIPDVEPEGETIEPDESGSKLSFDPDDDPSGAPSLLSSLPRVAATLPLPEDNESLDPPEQARRAELRRRVEAEDALAMTARIASDVDASPGLSGTTSAHGERTQPLVSEQPASTVESTVVDDGPTPFSKTEVVSEGATTSSASETVGAAESDFVDRPTIAGPSVGGLNEVAGRPSEDSDLRTLAFSRSNTPPVPQGAIELEHLGSLSGALADEELARIFEWLHRRHWSGDLVLSRGEVQKVVRWYDGVPLRCGSSLARDRVPDVLVRRGILTRRQYAELSNHRRPGQSAGPGTRSDSGCGWNLDELAEQGVIKAREVPRLHALWVRAVVEECFTWSEGQWRVIDASGRDGRFEFERQRYAELSTAFDTVRLVFDALGHGLDPARARALLADYALRPTLRDVPSTTSTTESANPQTLHAWSQRLALDADQQRWLGYCDGTAGGAAKLAADLDQDVLHVFLYAMQVIGAVEFPAPVHQAVANDPLALDRERIFERLRLARNADYFEFLGLPLDASSSEVRGAFQDLMANFADDALEPESARLYSDELSELRAALERARDLLVDEATRCAYVRQLSQSWQGSD